MPQSSHPNHTQPPPQSWQEATQPDHQPSHPGPAAAAQARGRRHPEGVWVAPPAPLFPFPTHGEVSAPGVPAATLTPGHTPPLLLHVAGLTDAALLADGGTTGALAPAFRVVTGRGAVGKAVGVDVVGGAFQSWKGGGETRTERGLRGGPEDRIERGWSSHLGMGAGGQAAGAARPWCIWAVSM